MEVYQLLRILSNYKRMIILLCLSATIHAVLLTYVVSEKYKATALVLVRPQENIKIASTGNNKELLNFPLPVTIPFEVMSQTYSEVIKSRTIAEKVVRTLHLDKEEVEENPWKRLKNKVTKFLGKAWTILKYGRVEEGNPFEKAVENVQDYISVTPTKDTYIFEIEYKAKDPNLAAAVANTAAEAFVEYSREANKVEAKGAREFIEDRLQESERELEEARRALQQFKEKHEVVLLEEELSTRIKVLSEFESSLENTQKDVKGTKAEIGEIRQQLPKQGKFLKSSSKVTNNPLVTDLKSELAKLEIKLSGLLNKFTPSHPEVISLQAEIAEAKTKLKKEVSKIISEETSTINTLHQKLLEDLILAEAKLQGLQAKRENLAGTITRQKDELKGFPDKQLQLAKLELNLKTAEDTYKFIRKIYEEARIREAEKISEIRVVSPAVAPTYPSKPIKIYYAGISFAMALVIGIGLALFFEYMNVRIRSIEEAERVLELPVLTTIPTMELTSDPVHQYLKNNSRVIID